MPGPISVAVEGKTDVPVVKRLLDLAGLEMGAVHGQQGKALLDQRLPGYNNAARHAPWLVVRDLDRDAACAPELVAGLLPNPGRWMVFRIAVRAMEAWLLADAERLSQFMRVALSRIPLDPDSVIDPKGEMVRLARASRLRAIREDMVPADGTSATVGPAYSARVIEFARGPWRPDVAVGKSRSLAGCARALSAWAAGAGSLG